MRRCCRKSRTVYPFDELQGRHAKRKFALALGRICPEKGFHHALDAAALARVPLLIAGRVFPYPDHEEYFAEKIRPRLGPQARFLGNLDFARKRRYLTTARCLLMPSLIAETSSLVAMEAIACGTPVVAFPVGALPDLIEPGVTGFLVDDTQQMAEAIHASGSIDRERCREVARRRFSLKRMVEGYFGYYRRLAAMSHAMRQPRDDADRASHVRGCHRSARAGMAGTVAKGFRGDAVPVPGMAVILVGFFR